MLHNYFETSKNIDARTIRPYIELFQNVYIKNLKLTKLRFNSFFRKLFQGF